MSRTRLRRFAALAASAGLLAVLFQTPFTPVAAPARALPGQPDAVFSTRGQIVQLAADGSRVAVITAGIHGAPPRTGCTRSDRIVVWTAPGRKWTSFKPGYLGCEGDGLGDLAVGGGQVAWIERGGGNFLELQVMVANLSGRAARLVEEAHNGARAAGNASGQWVGHLLGGGPLLAYNSWTVVCDLPPDHGCAPYRPSEFHLTEQRLVRISAGHRLGVKSGPAAYRLSAVGGGRMAVESAGAVTVLAVRLSDGKPISLPLHSGAKDVIDARLTEAGAFYAYNAPRASAKGRIVFEPTAKLLARF